MHFPRSPAPVTEGVKRQVSWSPLKTVTMVVHLNSITWMPRVISSQQQRFNDIKQSSQQVSKHIAIEVSKQATTCSVTLFARAVPDYLLGTEGIFLGAPVLRGLEVPLQQNN
jgi:hypothetical protein